VQIFCREVKKFAKTFAKTIELVYTIKPDNFFLVSFT